MKSPLATLFLVTFLFSASAQSKAVRFDMRDAGQRNIVHFVSDALLEKTIGLSNSVAGWIELDPHRLNAGVKGEFEADMRTFNTGVELRNDYFKQFVSASEFPVASFAISRLVTASKNKLVDNAPVTLRVDGVLRARELTKPQSILLRLIYFKESELTKQRLTGNLLKMSASFDVDTAQFNVTIPEMQRTRLSRFIQVTVDAIGTDRPPGALITSEGEKVKDSKAKPTNP